MIVKANNQSLTLLFSIFYFPFTSRVMVLNMLRLDAKLSEIWVFAPFLLGALSGNRYSSASYGAEATLCGKVLRMSVDGRRRN